MRVDVILVSYNQENYIAQAVESILMQQVRDDVVVRIIVADDCSTDNTLKIIKSYDSFRTSFSYDRKKIKFLYLSSPINLGLGGNYQRAFAACDADYISILEGDDYWTNPQKLQKQIDFLEENTDSGLVYTDYDVVDIEGCVRERAVFHNNPECHTKNFEDHLLQKAFIAPLTWMFRADLLKIIDKNNFCDMSFAIALDMFKNTNISYLDCVTSAYRMHIGSLSKPKSILDQYKLHKSIFKIQLYYLNKYNCEERLFKLVKSQNYLGILPFALELKDWDFVNEVREWASLNDIEINSYINVCNYNNEICNAYNKILVSRSFKLGCVILRPLKLLKKIIKSQK